MYWTEKDKLYYLQQSHSLTYSLLQIRALKSCIYWLGQLGLTHEPSVRSHYLSEEISYVWSVAFPVMLHHYRHRPCPSFDRYLQQTGLANITTLEKKDMNSSFSGLVSLSHRLCVPLLRMRRGSYQHTDEDRVQFRSHIPLAHGYAV